MWWWLLFVTTLASYYYVSRTTFFLDLATGLFSSSPLSFTIISGGAKTDSINMTVDLSWHAPISSSINNLTLAINGTGTYGFIFNSSTLPDGVPYGIALSDHHHA